MSKKISTKLLFYGKLESKDALKVALILAITKFFVGFGFFTLAIVAAYKAFSSTLA